jgi:anti-sigma regulatory factor (Ser/Thr protein kinase)
MSRLEISRRTEGGTVVVSADGALDLTTYPVLRDALLKSAIEASEAVIVDISRLEVDRVTSLSLFPTVWMRISVWPGIPLLLAGAHPASAEMLRRSAVPRFVPCHAGVAEALAAVREKRPPPCSRAELDLWGDAHSSRQARDWVRKTLSQFGVEESELAVLVACELVENAATHAGTRTTLRLELHPAGLSVAVSDDDPRPPQLPPTGAPSAGSGLALIDTLARAWGHDPRWNGGKVVWAVLPVAGGPDGPIDPPTRP